MRTVHTEATNRLLLRDVADFEHLWPGMRVQTLGSERFSSAVVRKTLPSILLERISASPFVVRRRSTGTCSSAAPWPRTVHIVTSGRVLVWRGSQREVVEAGSLFTLDAAGPVEYRCPVRATVLRIAVPGTAARAGRYRATASRTLTLSGSPVAAALASLVQDLLSEKSAVTTSRASMFKIETAVLLLEQGVLTEIVATHDERSDADEGLRAAVLAQIEVDLRDGDLSPARLAAHFGISVRTLHKLFEQLPDTAAGHIRRRRVEEAATVLRSRASISGELAAALGFGSTETFLRAFHRAYGVRPAEYHARHRTAPS